MSRDSRNRFLTVVLLAIIILAGVIAWKGYALAEMSRSMDVRAVAVASYYRDLLSRETPGIAVSGSGSAEERDALGALRSADLATDGRTRLEVLGQIVDVQKRLDAFFGAIAQDDLIAESDAAVRLRADAARDGDLKPLLDGYNVVAQSWNNEQENPLGGMYFRLFKLRPAQLLGTDGRVEFETKVSL